MCFGYYMGINRGLSEGGHWLERGYGDVRPWRPPFHASPAARKGPISSKRVSSQDPFWENLEILASTASIFTQILAHKPPNLEIFSSQAPKFGNFPLTSPPFQRQAPRFGNPGRTPLPEKSWVPPRGTIQYTFDQFKNPRWPQDPIRPPIY